MTKRAPYRVIEGSLFSFMILGVHGFLAIMTNMKVRHKESIGFALLVLICGAPLSFLIYIVPGLFFDQYLSDYFSFITGKELSIVLGYSIASGIAYSHSKKELFDLLKIKDD